MASLRVYLVYLVSVIGLYQPPKMETIPQKVQHVYFLPFAIIQII